MHDIRLNLLEITTRVGCRNMCPYCPQDKLVDYKGIRVLSFDTFKSCIDRLDTKTKIVFAGMCEPFLNRSCMRMIEYVGQEYPVHISTTLVGFRESYIKRLEKIKLKTFLVHLPGKGDTYSVYTELLKKITESKISGKRYHYHGGSLKELDFLDAKETVLHSRGGNADVKKVKSDGTVACTRNMLCPVLMPNGDLAVCCMDFGLKHIMGNLLTDSKDDIFGNIKKARAGLGSDSICHYCHWAK